MATTTHCDACNQDSTESDYCSNCGTQLSSSPAADPIAAAAVPGGAPSATATGGHEKCPVCGTDREDPTGPFCAVCSYNFVTHQGGDVVQPTPAPTANAKAAPATTGSATPAATRSGARMDLVVTVDTTVGGAPKGRQAFNFSLFDEESLVGRVSTSLRQEVAIDDAAVSKRQALIVRQADGSYIIRDLNSSNGTFVNGTQLVAGADHPLKEGDVVKVGEFSVITVKEIRPA